MATENINREVETEEGEHLAERLLLAASSAADTENMLEMEDNGGGGATPNELNSNKNDIKMEMEGLKTPPPMMMEAEGGLRIVELPLLGNSENEQSYHHEPRVQYSDLIEAYVSGTLETQRALRKECEFLLECHLCREIFRCIPSYVAHKQQEGSCRFQDFVGSSTEEGHSSSRLLGVNNPPVAAAATVDEEENQMMTTAEAPPTPVKMSALEFYNKVGRKLVHVRRSQRGMETASIVATPLAVRPCPSGSAIAQQRRVAVGMGNFLDSIPGMSCGSGGSSSSKKDFYAVVKKRDTAILAPDGKVMRVGSNEEIQELLLSKKSRGMSTPDELLASLLTNKCNKSGGTGKSLRRRVKKHRKSKAQGNLRNKPRQNEYYWTGGGGGGSSSPSAEPGDDGDIDDMDEDEGTFYWDGCQVPITRKLEARHMKQCSLRRVTTVAKGQQGEKIRIKAKHVFIKESAPVPAPPEGRGKHVGDESSSASLVDFGNSTISATEPSLEESVKLQEHFFKCVV